MKKKNIAILYGGTSSERVISVKTAGVVKKHLDSNKGSKYNTFMIDIGEKNWNLTDEDVEFPVNKADFSVETNDGILKFDCAFIAIHGDPGENGKLQGYFDLIGIPYTSSDQLTTALTFNKWMCNTLLKQLEVATTTSVLLRKKQKFDKSKIAEEIGFPCFVKPNSGGSSFGITKVKESSELDEAIKKAFEQDSEVLVEKFVMGMEVSCGIYKKEGELVVLPLTEIVSKNEFFDFAGKYEGAADEITPARIDKEQTRNIQQITAFIYSKLGLKGLCRMDYIIQHGEPYLIEVNTVPGLSEASIVPQQAVEAGVSLEELFETQVEECLNQ